MLICVFDVIGALLRDPPSMLEPSANNIAIGRGWIPERFETGCSQQRIAGDPSPRLRADARISRAPSCRTIRPAVCVHLRQPLLEIAIRFDEPVPEWAAPRIVTLVEHRCPIYPQGALYPHDRLRFTVA
jgi:hypothetical protein